MTSTHAAVAAFPELVHLVTLRAAGWRFLPPSLEDGHPVMLDGFHAWPNGWTDAIRIRGENDVYGLRFNDDEPPGIVWEHNGSLAEVVPDLLTLPAPGERLAPRLVIGTAPTPWTV